MAPTWWERKWDKAEESEAPSRDTIIQPRSSQRGNYKTQKRKSIRHPWSESWYVEKLLSRDQKRNTRNVQWNHHFRSNDWTKEMISVLLRNGEPALQTNYRPLCSLYKLFSTLIYSILYEELGSTQTLDEAVFRCGYKTTGHLSPAGVKYYGSQRSTPRRYSTRSNTAAYEQRSGNKEECSVELVWKLCLGRSAQGSLLFNALLQHPMESKRCQTWRGRTKHCRCCQGSLVTSCLARQQLRNIQRWLKI